METEVGSSRFVTHLPLYLIEGWGLGTFMISACLFTILLEHPDAGMVHHIHSPLLRRACIGLAMGLTATGIIYSPWGKKSGAHLNPSVTGTMLFLGRIHAVDAFWYIIFQTIGGTAGVYAVAAAFPEQMQHPSVFFAVTVPGKEGIGAAVAGEALISFLLMFVSMKVSSGNLKGLAGLISGFLIWVFIMFEAPYSGMSMNPARTIASAVPSHTWTAWPLYMMVPPLSMLLAAILRQRFSNLSGSVPEAVNGKKV